MAAVLVPLVVLAASGGAVAATNAGTAPACTGNGAGKGRCQLVSMTQLDCVFRGAFAGKIRRGTWMQKSEMRLASPLGSGATPSPDFEKMRGPRCRLTSARLPTAPAERWITEIERPIVGTPGPVVSHRDAHGRRARWAQ